MNESFKIDPSLATSARAANESGSYLCASNVTPKAVRFIVSVFLCLLCSCRMSSTQITCSHFRKNRPKKRQKPAGCRSRIISKNRPVPIFGRSTGASLIVNILHPCNPFFSGNCKEAVQAVYFFTLALFAHPFIYVLILLSVDIYYVFIFNYIQSRTDFYSS